MNSILRKIGFFTAFILPFLTLTGFYAGGWWNFTTLFFAFILLPFIDQSVGIDTTNVAADQRRHVEEDRYYRWITYLWAYLQLAFVVWGAWAVTTRELSFLQWVGFTLSFALVTGGIGITVAHELGHKKSKHERWCAQMLLMTVCYMHFLVEHNRGHHVSVGTPADPATARKNENFYSFWVRSVFLGYFHAWQLEKVRLQKKGLPPWHFSNSMIRYAVIPVVFCALLTAGASFMSGVWHWEIPLFFVAQSIFAFTLLELVNYVEHYGITRKEISPGKFEPVNPLHSWNASHLISNFFLFQLQRHSDHHLHAQKRYQVLDHFNESPQLPFGYSTMIMMAMVPVVWFRIMNKRLDNWKKITESSPAYLADEVSPG